MRIANYTYNIQETPLKITYRVWGLTEDQAALIHLYMRSNTPETIVAIEVKRNIRGLSVITLTLLEEKHRLKFPMSVLALRFKNHLNQWMRGK